MFEINTAHYYISRFILRAALTQSWLPNMVRSMRTWPDVALMYTKDALILQSSSCGEGKDTLLDILSSLTAEMDFQLNLKNRAFLDTTWEMPKIRRYELVPSTDLGLMIGIVNGQVIVTKVKRYSLNRSLAASEFGGVCVRLV